MFPISSSSDLLRVLIQSVSVIKDPPAVSQEPRSNSNPGIVSHVICSLKQELPEAFYGAESAEQIWLKPR